MIPDLYSLGIPLHRSDFWDPPWPPCHLIQACQGQHFPLSWSLSLNGEERERQGGRKGEAFPPQMLH